ncbi:MAG: protoporphyrinogen oxidase, partial [gamma proteobacterium symbiont of Bathyaustriella thionipta]|nr:protoporphyrinogen oxidase [gamma proteobacterium symbiont of Bathyaustriella thionipta]
AHKISGKRTARNPESFSFKKGMETLPQHLASDPNVGFHANISVTKIIHHAAPNSSHQKQYWEVQATGPAGEKHCKARHIVLSSPAESASQLIKPLNHPLSELLNHIEYAPLSVVHIGLERAAIKHPLDSAGFLVPRQEQAQAKIAINGNLWMSSVFSGRAPDNSVLLSSYLGGSRNPSAIQLSSQESIDQVLHDVSSLLGIQSNATPIMGRVDKHHKALPVYHGHYHQTLKAIEQELISLPGLHLVANYKGGVSVRDRIISAKETAAKIVNMMSLQDEKSHEENFSPFFIDKTVIERPA